MAQEIIIIWNIWNVENKGMKMKWTEKIKDIKENCSKSDEISGDTWKVWTNGQRLVFMVENLLYIYAIQLSKWGLSFQKQVFFFETV